MTLRLIKGLMGLLLFLTAASPICNATTGKPEASA